MFPTPAIIPHAATPIVADIPPVATQSQTSPIAAPVAAPVTNPAVTDFPVAKAVSAPTAPPTIPPISAPKKNSPDASDRFTGLLEQY